MRTRSVFLSLACLAGFTATARADVPDGKGGRTSPWRLTQEEPREVPVAMACCREPDTQAYRDRVTSPAERKATAHLAWVDARTGPAPVTLCYKTVPTRQAKYNSPAELKALGHLARPEKAGVDTSVRLAGMTCCNGQDVRSCRIHQPQR